MHTNFIKLSLLPLILVILFSCKKKDDYMKISDFQTTQGRITVIFDGFTNDSIYLKNSISLSRFDNSNIANANYYKVNDTLINVNFSRISDNSMGNSASFDFAFIQSSKSIFNMIGANFSYQNYQNGNEFLSYNKGFNGMPNDTNKIYDVNFDVASGRLTGKYTFKSRKVYYQLPHNVNTYMTISGDFDVTLNKVYQ